MKIPDSLKKVISSKVLKKAETGDSKVSGLKELDNVSKNLSFLPNIAKDLNIARQNIFKLVKLEGGKPERANNIGSGKTEKSPTPVFKDQAPMKKKEPKEESSFEMGQRFASFFLDMLSPKKLLAKISIGAIFMAAGIITLFKDAFLGLANYLFDAIKESFSNLVEYIGQFFKDVVQPILNELKIFFMEKIWPKIRDFFKPIFDWVGDKINSILEFLEPVFNFIGEVFGKIMAYVDNLTGLITTTKAAYDSIKKKLADASGPSSQAQYDELGNVISDSGDGVDPSVEANKEKNRKAAEQKDAADKAAADKAAADKNKPRGPAGRGGPTAAELAKKDLTPSQLKWLGGADPTDPYIMARMPPPQPGEKGGPPKAPTPAPAPAPTPAPTKPTPTKPAAAPSGGGMSDSKQMIIRHEGKGEKVPGGYKPYQDTRGYWTIGVGHLITKGKTLPKEWDRVFTEAEIMKMFEEDYAHHAAAAAKIPGFNLLGPDGQNALIDMTFNMGNSWYKNFPKAIQALAKGDFKTAADEFTDSDWYKQVKGRAATIVAIIRNSISATPVKGDTQVAKAETPSPSPAPAPAKPAPAPTPAPATAKPEPAKPAPSGKNSLASSADISGGVDVGGLNSGFLERLSAMAAAFKQETGKKLIVTSGFRSNEKQKQLYDDWKAGRLKVPAVAEPSAPLGKGPGSRHSFGTAVDIGVFGQKGIPKDQSLNILAGPRTKSTGWLEKFGLIRPVDGEDWHIQPSGTAPTPDNPENPGAPIAVPDKSGKAIDVATGKTEPVSTPAGDKISSASTELAADQRAQQKPTTPVVIDASTTNNTQVTNNESGGNKNKPNTNKQLLERVT